MILFETKSCGEFDCSLNCVAFNFSIKDMNSTEEKSIFDTKELQKMLSKRSIVNEGIQTYFMEGSEVSN